MWYKALIIVPSVLRGGFLIMREKDDVYNNAEQSAHEARITESLAEQQRLRDLKDPHRLMLDKCLKEIRAGSEKKDGKILERQSETKLQPTPNQMVDMAA